MEFRYRTIKEMRPQQGQRFATRYYKQSTHEYTRLSHFVSDTYEQIVTAAHEHDLMTALEAPLEGFRRTGKRANYSLLQILDDLYQQLSLGRDAPEAMIARWNRALPAHLHITMQEDRRPNPIFNQLSHA